MEADDSFHVTECGETAASESCDMEGVAETRLSLELMLVEVAYAVLGDATPVVISCLNNVGADDSNLIPCETDCNVDCRDSLVV